MPVEKYIRPEDGHVGVLVSPGFGAGWSTWAGEKNEEGFLFDKDLVAAALEGDHSKIREICAERYPEAYLGGLEDLRVDFLPPGTAFRIHEYDGSESLVIISQEKHWVA